MRGISAIPLFILFLLLTARPGHAQQPELILDSEFRTTARAAVDSIYNFKFSEAADLLRPWREEHPDHPLWTLLGGMEVWWRVLSDLEDRSGDQQLFHIMGQADYESGRLLRSNGSHADALIIRAVSNGYMARQKANREEWISSLNSARKALNAHDYLMELHPEMADLKLAEGLKLYYSDYLPEAYPVVRTVSWFLPDGDRKKGMALMKDASEESVFAGAEATYFLGNVNINYEKDPAEAVGYFRRLYRKYPDNNFYARLYARSLFRLDRYDEAEPVIDEALERWRERDLPYRSVLEEELLTLQGRIQLRRRQFSAAEATLARAYRLGYELPNRKDRRNHVISGYFLGRALSQLNEDERAVEVLREVSRHSVLPEYRKLAGQLADRIAT